MRRSMKTSVSLALTAALAAGLLSACGSSTTAATTAAATTAAAETGSKAEETTAAATEHNSIINAALGSAWADLIPYNAASGGYITSAIHGMLYERLFYVAQDGTITPRGADSWEIADDAKSIVFHLNHDVCWDDGEPVTAQDYVFAAKMITSPDCPANQRSPYSLITGCDGSGYSEGGEIGAEAVDDYTLKYTFKDIIAEDVTFPSYLYIIMPLPEHLLADVAPADYLTQDLWNHPVSCGPLSFESMIAGSDLVLNANKNYHMGAPKFSQLHFQVMATTNQASAMISGDIDFCYPNMTADDIEVMETADNLIVKRAEVPTLPYYLCVNQLVFNDYRINKALSLAIDREAIAASWGDSSPIVSPVLMSTKYYKEYDAAQDLEAAKALLEEAAADGSIDLSQTYTLYTPSGRREAASAIMQQCFAEIGLNVEIQVVEAATMFAGFADGTTGFGMVGMNCGANPLYLKSQLTNDAYNFSNVQDDTWDGYYDRFMKASSDDERMQIVSEYQDEFAEKEPMVFYNAVNEDWAWNKRLGDDIHLVDILYGALPVWDWDVQD